MKMEIYDFNNKYKGFILRPCRDKIHYDILRETRGGGEHLIAIVGSCDEAKKWVDEWYRKHA